MNATRSVDDLLIRDEAVKLGKPMPDSPQNKSEEIKAEQHEPVVEDNKAQEPVSDDQPQEELQVEQKESQLEEQENKGASEPTQESDVDEYGTKIGKPKLYTQDEVNQMIRDRLSRGKYAEQQPQVQEAAKNFQSDPTSDETWEVQLEKFIENTITKVSQKQQQDNWKKQEEMTQADFETKFTTGMTKYNDFADVVKDKPITTSMMMATRSMQDPAAFLYAASKQHPNELDRISKIADPYAQVAEMGRLEERMKKARLVTTAPKPSRKISGDSTDKMPDRSIDQLIMTHAKSKIMNNPSRK